jgi:hypothetical protein
LVILHKLPEGFTVASIMMASGRNKTFSPAAAGLGFAALAGVLYGNVEGVGAVWTTFIGWGDNLRCASDLMPEVNEEPGVVVTLRLRRRAAIHGNPAGVASDLIGPDLNQPISKTEQTAKAQRAPGPA